MGQLVKGTRTDSRMSVPLSYWITLRSKPVKPTVELLSVEHVRVLEKYFQKSKSPLGSIQDPRSWGQWNDVSKYKLSWTKPKILKWSITSKVMLWKSNEKIKMREVEWIASDYCVECNGSIPLYFPDVFQFSNERSFVFFIKYALPSLKRFWK